LINLFLFPHKTIVVVQVILLLQLLFRMPISYSWSSRLWQRNDRIRRWPDELLQWRCADLHVWWRVCTCWYWSIYVHVRRSNQSIQPCMVM